MESKKSNRAVTVSLILAFAQLCIQLPLWYGLLLGILITIQPSTWVWVFFFCYVPVSVGVHIIKSAVEAVVEGS